jgi:MFS transporter, DHA3 family, macrolide efflux protein
MAGVGLVPAQGFWVAVSMVFIVGFCLPLVNGPLQAAVQAAVEPEYQGRVFTLIGSIATAMTPLSLIIAGPAADWLGIRSWFVAAGLMAAVLGLIAFLSPAIMGFEKGRNKPVGGQEAGQDAKAGLASQPAELSGD